MGRPSYLSALPLSFVCESANAPAPRRVHALSRQPGREAPLPHGSPATSRRRRRSNHPNHEMIREVLGRNYPCEPVVGTQRRNPLQNPLPLCWTIHAPGGRASVSSAGQGFVSGFLTDSGRWIGDGSGAAGWRQLGMQRNVGKHVDSKRQAGE